MFKSIKEFFVGKPKVEETPVPVSKVEEPAVVVTEPVVLTPVETVTPVQPVVEEIKPETVIISVSDNMNVSVGSQSDTITLTPHVEPSAWPFPNTPPAEKVTKKKPAPAMTATKTKPRKKK
jgi:hypothetical protein